MKEYMREGKDLVKMRWWCMRKHEQGWSGDKIAAHLQVPERTVYYWMDKYAGCDKEEMVNRPNKVEIEVDERTRKFVLKLRKKYDFGPCRIERY
ncbi:MAG: helix-turn-helix domain-containing protein, partial [Methanobacteriota archaeon]